MISRRFVAGMAVGSGLPVASTKWRVGVPDWNLKLGANPGAAGVAAPMGEGTIQLPGVLAAMREIGFAGFANIELDGDLAGRR